MLTDLRLQKYLDGRLSRQETRELEALLEKSPEMRERLEALKGEGEGAHLGHMRRRRHLQHDAKRGSRIRTGILLPALVILLLILGLASHWFVKPGGNSTFALQGGNGHAVDLLYDSPQGWRYFDAGFKPGDSLTFMVRETGNWHVAVMAVEAFGKETRLLPLWRSRDSVTYAKAGNKPAFPSLPAEYAGKQGNALEGLKHYVAFFSQEALPEFHAEEAADILQGVMAQRDAATYRFQVFSVKPREMP